MITQTIKNWLGHLFAWWPWKRTEKTAYVPSSRNGAMGISQEHLWSASGMRSVAIEQTNENAPPEATLPLRPPLIEHIETITQPTTLRDVSSPPLSARDEKTLESPTLSANQFDSEMPPIPEQQMVFLQYLVRHGLINEGFEEGSVPEQYRQKQ